MVAINNTHNGIDLYGISNGTALEHFVETGLYDASESVFLNSDRILVHPGSDGVLKAWDVKSRTYVGSVHGGFAVLLKQTPAFSRDVTPDGQLPQILAVEVQMIWWGFTRQHALTTVSRLAFAKVTMGTRCWQLLPGAVHPPNSIASSFGGATEVRFRFRHPERSSLLLSAESEVLARQAQSDFSMFASLVVVSAIIATWYLTWWSLSVL